MKQWLPGLYVGIDMQMCGLTTPVASPQVQKAQGIITVLLYSITVFSVGIAIRKYISVNVQ